MHKIRVWVRAYFGFSRTETNAFLILLPLMAMIVLVEPAYEYWYTRQPQDFSEDVHVLDSTLATLQWPHAPEAKKSSVHNTNKPTLRFKFNPNKSTMDEFIRLGFGNFLAQRIVNYRTKGGKFIIKTDLLKIYRMDTSLYRDLYSYIDLPDQKEDKKSFTATLIPKKKDKTFDINQADTIQLSTIYGIGAKLSQRITRYRSKVGGFVSMNQLYDVYGLDSAVVTELKNHSYIAADFLPKQININSATEKELSSHPYIKYSLAKTITAYRFQHGPFQSVDDLKKIALIDESLFQKIKPYISLNP
jgi:competence ComEA-like helix-hairpin-helix protein